MSIVFISYGVHDCGDQNLDPETSFFPLLPNLPAMLHHVTESLLGYSFGQFLVPTLCQLIFQLGFTFVSGFNAGLGTQIQAPVADFLDNVIGTLNEGLADEIVDFLKNDLPELSNIVAVQAADFFDTVFPQLVSVLQQPAADFFDKVLPNLIENVQELSVSRSMRYTRLNRLEAFIWRLEY